MKREWSDNEGRWRWKSKAEPHTLGFSQVVLDLSAEARLAERDPFHACRTKRQKVRLRNRMKPHSVELQFFYDNLFFEACWDMHQEVAYIDKRSRVHHLCIIHDDVGHKHHSANSCP